MIHREFHRCMSFASEWKPYQAVFELNLWADFHSFYKQNNFLINAIVGIIVVSTEAEVIFSWY